MILSNAFQCHHLYIARYNPCAEDYMFVSTSTLNHQVSGWQPDVHIAISGRRGGFSTRKEVIKSHTKNYLSGIMACSGI